MAGNFFWDQFETIETPSPQGVEESDFASVVEEPNLAQEPQSGDYWDQYKTAEPEDSLGKSIVRKGAQVGKGALNITPYGIATNLWSAFGSGEALAALDELDESRIAELKEKFPNAPWGNFKGIDKDKYLESLELASKGVPTIENISSWLEKATGLPLEAKTFVDRLFGLAGSGFKMRGGSLPSKLQAGAVAPAVSGGLQALGVPEPLAEVGGLVTSGVTPTVAGISKEIKPSGLPKRGFESLKTERRVTPRQAENIRLAIEKDVKSATDKFIQSESITARAIKEDPQFPRKIDNLLEKVEKLAEELPDANLDLFDVREAVKKRVKNRPTKGITDSEKDRVYLKEMNRLSKELRKKGETETTNKELLDQYRKTNRELKGYFEQGKSKGANEGKKEALLDYNRAISDIWQERFPDSEFNDLFKFTNKRYGEIADLEVINDFFDKVFTETKVDYRQAKNFFKNQKVKRSFERTLGEDGFKQVEGIFDDFISSEKAYKLIKKAESSGNVVNYARKWMFSPLLSKASALKDASEFIRNELLSNQNFRVTWKTGIEDFKAGRFKEAEKSFKKLDDMEAASKARKNL